MELLLHIPVMILVIIDLYQHWTHHRRGKKNREPLYTLDQAKAVLYDKAVADGIITYQETIIVPSHADSSLIRKST
jgi:hypothetical protein